ncbi:hypothetical protein OG320_05120 [Microbispora sp. NBC_01189]|uniref:hypothetical protein n=1 Tax=Microbispora sp. NBC_01189 TaxID=2903583 RepID=UPI002E0FC62C|nr:hypothetical protein OG320_05120 [Microbispora sp. NBC_01189]
MTTSRRHVHEWPGLLRPIWVAAAYTGRPERTIRTWARDLRVTSAWHLPTAELLVDLGDVVALNGTAQRRTRTAA